MIAHALRASYIASSMCTHSLHRRLESRRPCGGQLGFSLVEAAIVLVVIGIILGAVLQGRSLIESAEYKSFSQQLRDTRTAFQSFLDRYGALPGDFVDADERVDSDAPVPSGSTAGNGLIDNGPTCDDTDDESCIAWQHLRYAGLLGGNPTLSGVAASPSHAVGGVVSGFFTGNDGNNEFGNKLLVQGVPVEIATRLDREEDNDLCDSGRVSLSPRSACVNSGEDWPDAGPVDIVYAL